MSSPATSVDVERLFSQGRILLPHLRNGLSAASVRALLCLGDWTRLGLVEDDDVSFVTVKDDDGDDESTDEMDPSVTVIDISIL